MGIKEEIRSKLKEVKNTFNSTYRSDEIRKRYKNYLISINKLYKKGDFDGVNKVIKECENMLEQNFSGYLATTHDCSKGY